MAAERSMSKTIKSLRTFLPAKDFGVSQAFYRDLGFQATPLGPGLVAMRYGACAFLLQNYFVQDWAENTMMHALVEDLAMWWSDIAALDLASRYNVQEPRPPKLEPWGLTVAYVFDPSGVLWHFAEESTQS